MEVFLAPPSYCVYISQLIRFARVWSIVDDFNYRNTILTSKLLKQGYRYLKFDNRHSELNVLWLFLTVPWIGLQCVIVIFPDHTHFFFGIHTMTFDSRVLDTGRG